MRVSCVQMDMLPEEPGKNFDRAEELIRKAAEGQPDVIVLPETWNSGFFPRELLRDCADRDGNAVKTRIGALAKELGINIIAGSVANLKNDKIYNTCYVFDRSGKCIAEYDKTHLFTPMKEDLFFEKGSHLAPFELDGLKCGVIICYDIRFPELTRTYALQGLDFLFIPAQWPAVRIPHLLALSKARAIENQMFTVTSNSCGKAGKTVYGGNSVIHDPWGEVLAKAGEGEEIIAADCDPGILAGIRETINVFRDRRPELYHV